MLLADLYTISDFKETDEKTLSLTVKINPDHLIFKGHFPKNPITPGVAILQILKNCLEQHFENKLFMQSTSNVKFLSPVLPKNQQELNYLIQFQVENQFLKVKNSTSFKDGTSVLKCNATFAIQS